MPSTRRRSDPPTARIHGPAELLQAIPYLLGFHPHDSLVLVGLQGTRLVVTARLDLSDAAEPGVIAHSISAMSGGGAGTVVGVVYDDDAAPAGGPTGAWTGLVAAVAADAAANACNLSDVLVVAGRRWWSLCCADEACCPPSGRDLPATPSEFTAAATVQGVVALPDRAALAAVIDPVPHSIRAALEPIIEHFENAAVAAVLAGHTTRWDRSVKRALFTAARGAEAPGWSGPNDTTVARFGVALGTVAIRDAVWMAIDDGRLPGRALWRDLARRLPAPYGAAPLFLFGWSAWRAGEGALANIAADRALESDPGYSAADLLVAALARGVDPRQLPKLRQRRPA